MKERDRHRAAPGGLSRRDVLVLGALGTFALGTPGRAKAAVSPPQRARAPKSLPGTPALPKIGSAAVKLADGRILVTGGVGAAGGSPTSGVFLFDPGNGRWSRAAAMAAPRAQHAAVLLDDGRVAVLGGLGPGPLASVEVYDPRLNMWQPGAPLRRPRYEHAAASEGGRIFLFGGGSDGATGVEEYALEATTLR